MRNRRIDCDLEDILGPELVAIAETAQPVAMDLAERIEDALLDGGIIPDPETVRTIEGICEDEAFALAGSFVRSLLLSLNGSTAAIALRRVILGPDGISAPEAARALGVSRQALEKVEGKMRKRVGVACGRYGVDEPQKESKI